jgi:type IV pilus assembly protein PilB
MTIEDPVEYEIAGVNQIQVNVKTNLMFAKGLRSIVRQDPNIILVGEVRDPETAGIAVNSAMTGHLVLSTLHTNDAATAIPRLIDMEVEPFLIASSVNVIIAQRLVRTICIKCRVSEEVTKKAIATLLQTPERVITGVYPEEKCRTYKGKGCPLCHNTGYVGRIGLFEVMEITDAIREAITSKKDASAIRIIAVKEGMSTMLMEGLKKVKEGVTTLEEIIRVVKE